MKIIGLFPYYVLLAKTQNVVCVLNFTLMGPHVKHFIISLQHDFLQNRFCTTQLLSVNAISQNLDQNTQTEVIYLDLAKAFDSVDH